jgi:tRNA(fMet)-specific endonuclease VapC
MRHGRFEGLGDDRRRYRRLDRLSSRQGPRRIELELERGQLRTTVISRFELLAGARSARQQKLIEQLLLAVPPLLLDVAAADRAAQVRRALEKEGRAIGMGDSLIAGIVLANRGILLTRNRAHFERVPGLSLGTVRS